MPSIMGNTFMPKKSSKKGPRNGGIPQNAYAQSLESAATSSEEILPVVTASSETTSSLASEPELASPIEEVAEPVLDLVSTGAVEVKSELATEPVSAPAVAVEVKATEPTYSKKKR